ncbi:FAD/NAD(P)-binding domain-containing protein [Mycena rebaudengoi]|nr:FAD/NAD(P)-binding domain-containing protein [Mycena rebaudengoi]
MTPSTQPLNVSIVGAGIAGLTAAAALRRSGHRVHIFEALENKREIGAGLSVQVNSLRVLRHLGVSKENLNGVDLKGVVVFDSKGTTEVTIPFAEEKHENLLCLRSDLHDELFRIAGGEGFEGPPAKMHLGSKVVACDVEEGSITLANGQVVHADLILAADGMNSGLRTEILGQLHKAVPSGFTVFRCVFDASRLGPEMGWVTDGLPGTRNVMGNEEKYRMIAVYTCSGGSVVNLVGLYEDSHQTDPAWSSKGTREEFLEEFKSFNPMFQSLISLVDNDVIKFQLRSVPLLDTWTRGRAILIGDAAHGSLPALGQGAGMAIEEGGALGCLFPLGTRREDVPARLAAFQALRKERGEFVNIESLEQITIPAKRGTFAKSREMQAYIVEYDAIQAAQECYQEYFGGQQ